MGVEINIPAVSSPAVSIPAISITAVDVEVAAIVAKQSFLNKTSNVATTTVYTPSVSGLYRLNVLPLCSAGGAGVTVNVTWTDDYRTNSAAITYVNNPETDFPKVFRLAASSNVQIATVFSGSGHYDVYVVIEQLW